jgi:hypothetical protein
MNYVNHRHLMRQSDLTALIESACQSLEISSSQNELARKRYEAVGDWLSRADDPLLATIAIQLQGSVAIGTTIKPIDTNEYDVDLVAHVGNLDVSVSPTSLKKSIGDRLRSNGTYADLVEEMPRCWRLNYANEFHLDITPSIPNPSCTMGGELVPDKSLRIWKASNPQGYRVKFERRAALVARFRRPLGKAFDSARADADIEPYPENRGLKGILRRVVQITKRHRDVYFIDEDQTLAPLSIIITTLASRAYEYCVTNFEYDDELDLVCDVVRKMPAMMEVDVVNGRQTWSLWNMTTAGENFCEKWNKDPRRSAAFFSWHAAALSDLEALAAAEGLDQVRRQLGSIFGAAPATMAMDALTERINRARSDNHLSVSRPTGLLVGTAVGATPVRANTFFGADF